jgi:hypothetical protein
MMNVQDAAVIVAAFGGRPLLLAYLRFRLAVDHFLRHTEPKVRMGPMRQGGEKPTCPAKPVVADRCTQRAAVGSDSQQRSCIVVAVGNVRSTSAA